MSKRINNRRIRQSIAEQRLDGRRFWWVGERSEIFLAYTLGEAQAAALELDLSALDFDLNDELPPGGCVSPWTSVMTEQNDGTDSPALLLSVLDEQDYPKSRAHLICTRYM